MTAWTRWHLGPRRYRLPLKCALFILTTALVLYPKVWLLPTEVGRIRDMNSVLDPENPGLAPLEAEVRNSLADGATPPDALAAVQQAVYERISYSWDWDVWGVVEYLPTVEEALAKGREDCDGRAVVAASLLRRMGYDAWLVSDLLHCWVETEYGETMNPTGGDKTLVGAEQGTDATVTLGLLRNIARGLSYGVAVFPLGRELIIVGALALLTMQPWSSFWRRVAGVLMLLLALALIRSAGQAAALEGDAENIAATMIGFVLAAGGWLVLLVKARATPPRSEPAPAE